MMKFVFTLYSDRIDKIYETNDPEKEYQMHQIIQDRFRHMKVSRTPIGG